jgi:hypothetical protein
MSRRKSTRLEVQEAIELSKQEFLDDDLSITASVVGRQDAAPSIPLPLPSDDPIHNKKKRSIHLSDSDDDDNVYAAASRRAKAKILAAMQVAKPSPKKKAQTGNSTESRGEDPTAIPKKKIPKTGTSASVSLLSNLPQVAGSVVVAAPAVSPPSNNNNNNSNKRKPPTTVGGSGRASSPIIISNRPGTKPPAASPPRNGRVSPKPQNPPSALPPTTNTAATQPPSIAPGRGATALPMTNTRRFSATEQVVIQDLKKLCQHFLDQVVGVPMTTSTTTSNAPVKPATVDLSGSFLPKEGHGKTTTDDFCDATSANNLDFFDTNSAGEIVLQKPPPMFPDELVTAGIVGEHSLAWWGIQDPAVGEGKFRLPLGMNAASSSAQASSNSMKPPPPPEDRKRGNNNGKSDRLTTTSSVGPHPHQRNSDWRGTPLGQQQKNDIKSFDRGGPPANTSNIRSSNSSRGPPHERNDWMRGPPAGPQLRNDKDRRESGPPQQRSDWRGGGEVLRERLRYDVSMERQHSPRGPPSQRKDWREVPSQSSGRRHWNNDQGGPPNSSGGQPPNHQQRNPNRR